MSIFFFDLCWGDVSILKFKRKKANGFGKIRECPTVSVGSFFVEIFVGCLLLSVLCRATK